MITVNWDFAQYINIFFYAQLMVFRYNQTSAVPLCGTNDKTVRRRRRRHVMYWHYNIMYVHSNGTTP